MAMLGALRRVLGWSDSGPSAAPVGVQAVRFRKFLENVRGVLDLHEDGLEKRRGDYIYDPQYVASLVDRTLERCAMFVFDAAVLAPAATEGLFGRLDALKSGAHATILGEAAAPSRDASAGAPAEELGPAPEPPEVEPVDRMLDSALAWMSDSSTSGSPSVMGLVRDALDHVFHGSAAGCGCLGPRGAHRSGPVEPAGLADLGVGSRPAPAVAPQALGCRPLALLIVGAEEETEARAGGAGAAEPGALRTWLAVVDEDYLDLSCTSAGLHVRLAAWLTGNVDVDFVFFAMDGDGAGPGLPPESFRVERTARGLYTWRYQAPTDELEQDLIRLGRALFGSFRPGTAGERDGDRGKG